ncbi:hypothetical protein TWF481_003700 [Arthrobotrys musiformis]|uniref:Uncharacterized protein n=1 Tax=Arthrobotrys musiformis TaxID=47236 RepID=A0AAV9WHC5_9PEZI
MPLATKILKPFLLALVITAINEIKPSRAVCLEVPEDYKSGDCTAKVVWRKVSFYKRREIQDRVAVEILDSLGNKISDTSTADFQNCRGSPGEECKFYSSLPNVLLTSPQHRKEYLQFWCGGMGWHTDTTPEVGPKYVEDGVWLSRRPWCGVYTDWVVLPPDGPVEGGRYEKNPDIDTIESRVIECKFQCGEGSVIVEDFKPCPPPAAVTTVTATEIKIKLYTSVKTEFKKGDKTVVPITGVSTSTTIPVPTLVPPSILLFNSTARKVAEPVPMG